MPAPRAESLIYTPGGNIGRAAAVFEGILETAGIGYVENPGRIGNLSTPDRIITTIGVGSRAPDALDSAIHTGTGIRRRVVLVASDIPDRYKTPRPSLRDIPSATTKWRRAIERDLLDVLALGTNGEVMHGAKFLDHLATDVPEEMVVAQLQNQQNIRTIVEFITRDTQNP